MRGLTETEVAVIVDCLGPPDGMPITTIAPLHVWLGLERRGLIMSGCPDEAECICDDEDGCEFNPTPLGLLLLALHKSGELTRAA
jgi:hypothetical protein